MVRCILVIPILEDLEDQRVLYNLVTPLLEHPEDLRVLYNLVILILGHLEDPRVRCILGYRWVLWDLFFLSVL